MNNNVPLLEIKDLKKTYSVSKQLLTAVNTISFQIFPGETLGLVGESGCGKSTTGRCLLRLEEPSSGHVLFDGKNVLSFNAHEIFHFRRQAQIIFQDPYASLNPRMTAQEIIAEPLRIHNLAEESQIPQMVAQLLDMVGLSKTSLSRFPHEFSGGQRQRIGIARALAVKPRFIVCDEPISALDVSVQAQIVNLLKNLQKEMGLTYLFIAHDLAMVKYISDRVAVMYLGHLVELATAEELYSRPQHPYTQALLSSISIPDPVIERQRARAPLKGELPSPLKIAKGCPFASRCPHAQSVCHEEKPELKQVAPGHIAACHFPK
ncbi:MAG: ABC transporter ATP-binding protein [Verrucomicrobia bacterium]|nr:ABC transporter ATP-binding protein [Verrucomicrobiota bacterium]